MNKFMAELSHFEIIFSGLLLASILAGAFLY